ncbi:MAG: hypothetical protein K1X53_07085 [Candidatus Sumerlaeaceae bacterium]|nr:hypothetical protein [Candidatus Sumerlaeaceae bacterium]
MRSLMLVAPVVLLPLMASAQPAMDPSQPVQPQRTPRAGLFGGRRQPTPAPEMTNPIFEPPPPTVSQPAESNADGGERRQTPRPRKTPAKAESDVKPKKEVTPKPTEKELKKKNAEAELAQAVDKATTTVADFLNAANNGLYTQARDFLTPQMQRYLDSDASIPQGGLKGVLDQITGDGSIRGWALTARVRGEGGRVEAEIEYRSGETQKRDFDLIKTGTDWKIILPVSGAPKAGGNGGESHKAAAAPAKAVQVITPVPGPSADPQPKAETPAPNTAAPAAPQPVAQAPADTAPKPAVDPVAAALTNPAESSAKEPEKPAAKGQVADKGKSALSDAPWQVDLRPGTTEKTKQ